LIVCLSLRTVPPLGRSLNGGWTHTPVAGQTNMVSLVQSAGDTNGIVYSSPGLQLSAEGVLTSRTYYIGTTPFVLSNVVQVLGNSSVGLAWKDDGSCWSWDQTLQGGVYSGNGTTNPVSTPVRLNLDLPKVPSVEMAVDASGDQIIDFNNLADKTNYFAYRINNNNDGNTNQVDYADGVVNGTNDVKDLIPVAIKIPGITNYSSSQIQLKIRSGFGSYNFAEAMTLFPTNAMQMYTNTTLQTGVSTLPMKSVTTNGTSVSGNFVQHLFNHNGEGIILVEGKQSRFDPLQVDLVASGKVVANANVQLLPIDIKVHQTQDGPQGSDPKYINAPEAYVASNFFSVWPNEEAIVKVKLAPPFDQPQNLPPNLIKWEVPGHTIPDNTLEAPLSWTLGFGNNTKKVKITIGGSEFKLHFKVQGVGILSEIEAAALVPNAAPIMLAYRQESLDFGTTYPAGPKDDAMRHAYWCSVSASTFPVTAGDVDLISTGHEYSNRYDDEQQAFNSTMDLKNNAVGMTVNHQVNGLPDRAAIRTELEQRYNAGEMYIWEIPRGAPSRLQGDSEGILIKSNGSRIH